MARKRAASQDAEQIETNPEATPIEEPSAVKPEPPVESPKKEEESQSAEVRLAIAEKELELVKDRVNRALGIGSTPQELAKHADAVRERLTRMERGDKRYHYKIEMPRQVTRNINGTPTKVEVTEVSVDYYSNGTEEEALEELKKRIKWLQSGPYPYRMRLVADLHKSEAEPVTA